MKKQIIGILSLIIILLSFLGCNSTSGNLETSDVIPVVENNPSEEKVEPQVDNTPLSPVVESKKETSKVFETSENLAKSETTENNANFSDDSLDVIVENEFPTEQVVQLTAVEMYQNFVAGCVLEPSSSPNQISKNKKFATAFSVKCTKDGNPVPNMLISVKYPAAQTNGLISFGQTIIETNENGIASFTPTNTSFSCNSEVYFYLTPETEDSETLEYAEKNAISIPYKVITNRFYDSGILAIADYNASNKALSTNTTATALQPPLRKAGFQTIGNAPFDASIITSKNLYNQAKSILGNTVSFMVYGTVKYAEPAEKLENGQYIVTFVTNFAVMNLRDGKIVYQTEFLTTETGASEWEATNKLRTQTIPAIITEKIIYGI
mgnify:CR=1 FL=1